MDRRAWTRQRQVLNNDNITIQNNSSRPSTKYRNIRGVDRNSTRLNITKGNSLERT